MNHSLGSVASITAIHNRHRYEREKREALQAWADRVSSGEVKGLRASELGSENDG